MKGSVVRILLESSCGIDVVVAEVAVVVTSAVAIDDAMILIVVDVHIEEIISVGKTVQQWVGMTSMTKWQRRYLINLV